MIDSEWSSDLMRVQTMPSATAIIQLLGSVLLGAVVMMAVCTGSAYAAYGNVTQDSEFDPSVLQIDEKTFLGSKVSGDYLLQDVEGKTFRLGDLPPKPLILVLSYYTCDGACSVINKTLATTLQEVKRWKIGQDYTVLTVSFDRHDTPATMRKFMEKMGFKDRLPDGWRMATMQNREDIDRLAKSIGFKFFWSPRDRLFLHPSVYTLLSKEGRVARYLYAGRVGADDMEIALTKAMGGEISAANIIDFVVAACHSYNYKDGKYKLNIPLFVALGGLIAGVGILIGSYYVMKHRRVRDEKQIVAA